MARKILAVIAGYLVFAVSSVMLFNLTGQRPHQDAALAFKCLTIGYGTFFSVLAAIVVLWIGRIGNLTLIYILAALMFGIATISMLTSGGSHWTQLFAIFIFAPATVLGGYLKIRLTNIK